MLVRTRAPVVMMIMLLLAIILNPNTATRSAGNKCKIDSKVKLILKSMNKDTVTSVVDCVVGVGACDPTGQEIKDQAQQAVCTKCGRDCSCEQIQYRLVVRKMKKQFKEQWDRVVNKFKDSCQAY